MSFFIQIISSVRIILLPNVQVLTNKIDFGDKSESGESIFQNSHNHNKKKS